jgi:hypothetical protein
VHSCLFVATRHAQMTSLSLKLQGLVAVGLSCVMLQVCLILSFRCVADKRMCQVPITPPLPLFVKMISRPWSLIPALL